ncbi:GL16601 [Drosophila persimilis]|uniref:GL16601 n=1 Tax=Drosophila persimilis TaxID=7234 RepID=B4GWR6_DROPE|nr:pancreatic lipase-related protein 2 [Drosophila persimilis]EDW27150.1 GL16601 [Drosophila persimilis]
MPGTCHVFRRQTLPPPLVLLFAGLLLLGDGIAVQGLHRHSIMMKTFRYLQETMLRNSLERAHLNHGIVFECRTISDRDFGNEVHFLLQLGDLRGFRQLDASKKLALFLHGWNDKGSKDWVQELLLTWTLFDASYNVCVVDWGNLSQNDYKTASMSIFDVGLTVAGIIMALEELRPSQFHRSNVTLAGYSLGAHAAGYAGAVLEGQVEQIIGLDPAGPLFSLPAEVSPKYRLDPSDAKFVQVLHTSGGSLGTSLKCGHADFYPNGGRAPQTNCKMFMNLRDMQNTNPIACSHSAAAIFFRQSMDPQYPFVGYECGSYREFAAGYCDQNRRARFGIHSQRRAQGSFYFTTASQQPYVQRRLGGWLSGVGRQVDSTSASGQKKNGPGQLMLRLWTSGWRRGASRTRERRRERSRQRDLCRWQ